MAKVSILLDDAEKKLRAQDIETSQLDAEVLLSYVIKKPRQWILAHPKHPLTANQLQQFNKILLRRLMGEPIAYIVQRKEFFNLEFDVNNKVLIPRPETELLVEKALENVRSFLRSSQAKNKMIIIDVGTGSGNVIISLIKTLFEQRSTDASEPKISANNLEFFAIDTSKAALKVAKQNAKKHFVDQNIAFLSGRFLNPMIDLLDDMSSTKNPEQKIKLLILANLPYLAEYIYSSAPATVKNYEPKEALLSGKDGLDHFRKLLNQLKIIKLFHALPMTSMLEISPEQQKPISKLITTSFPKSKIQFFKDLAGKFRIIVFTV